MYERIEQRLCFSLALASHRTQSAEPESFESMERLGKMNGRQISMKPENLRAI